MKRRIRIQGFLIFLFLTLSILLSKFIFPQWKMAIWDEFFDALGIGIVLFGFLFRISARGYKAEKSSQGNNLITDGPYALIRNPMYFGTFLIVLGIILLLFNWWLFPVAAVIFLLIYIPQTRKEEQKLYQQFGDEYLAYCKKTPKYFIPLASLFKLEIRSYLPLKWRWVKKELISLVVAVAVIIAIEAWEDIRLLGSVEYLKEVSELSAIIISYLIILPLFYKHRV